MKRAYTTQAQVRAAFWEVHPALERAARKGPRGRVLPQNSQPANVREAFVCWVDFLERDGQITQALAQRVTL